MGKYKPLENSQRILSLWHECNKSYAELGKRLGGLTRDRARALVTKAQREANNAKVSEEIESPLVRFPDKKKPITDFMQLLEHADSVTNFRNATEPNQLQGTVDFSKWGDTPICIMQMTDVHVGSAQTDYYTLVKHISYLRAIPNLYCIMTGDFIEGKANSRHMDATLSQVFPPQMQARVRDQMFKYLWEKIIVDVDGNHDLYPYIYGGINVNEFIARGGIWLKDGGRIIIKMAGNIEYTLLILHGDGVPGNSMYDKAAAMDRAQRMQFGWHDIALIGHTHEAQIKIKEEPLAAGNTAPVIVCRGGTYKTLGGEMYAERMGFAKPSGVYMPAFIIFPRTKRVLPFYRVEDAIEVLKALTPKKIAAKI